MRLEHHLVGGYVRYISPHIIIIIINFITRQQFVSLKGQYHKGMESVSYFKMNH